MKRQLSLGFIAFSILLIGVIGTSCRSGKPTYSKAHQKFSGKMRPYSPKINQYSKGGLVSQDGKTSKG